MSMPSTRYSSLPVSLPPRGLSRVAAADYIGISPTKFDEMVEDGRMPGAKTIDSRKVWDRLAIDAAFSALPGGGPSGQEASDWD